MRQKATRHSRAALSRRIFLGASAAAAAAGMGVTPESGQNSPRISAPPATNTYETHMKSIRILPGQWRPHYPWEHIAWVSPPWPSQDYIWLDFPEAIFTNQGLLFLSHVNPAIDSVFHDLPPVSWDILPDGTQFDRTLPNGVAFGGSLRKNGDTAVALELRLRNGSRQPLTDITLQTCAFLRAIREFGEYTRENKMVHTPDLGWIPLSQAMELPDAAQPYRIGWRTRGRRTADLPAIATLSNVEQRLFVFTWGKATLSLIGNPNHPCVHADPQFPNLEPGQEARIRGRLLFFEGPLSSLDLGPHLADI